jgi:hypothetical protein
MRRLWPTGGCRARNGPLAAVAPETNRSLIITLYLKKNFMVELNIGGKSLTVS